MNKREYGMRFHFWDHVKKTRGCWEWQAYVRKGQGYGQIWNGDRVEFVHRFSYRMNVGPIPKGLMVCHHCDNRKCVRPDHLFVGTARDNLHDMTSKGRHVPASLPGESNPSAVLTAAKVRFIRRAYKPHIVTAMSLADKFGVSEGLIFHIVKGRAWKHLL